MQDLSLDALEKFIVRAKAATYVGSGAYSLSHRPASHDLEFHEGPFAYLDSYFGGSDFIGEEVVYYNEQPVWAMNYYGRLVEPAAHYRGRGRANHQGKPFPDVPDGTVFRRF